MKQLIFPFVTAYALSGCADLYLDAEIRRVEQANVPLGSFEESGKLTANSAMKLAFEMADGYASAARSTAVTQDIASGGLILAAGSTALGIADSVANEILAERVVTAVAFERFLSRGVPKDAIVALYDGASRHNCVALTGRLYTKVDLTTLRPSDRQPAGAIEDEFAAFLMVLVMREIEYRTYAGLSRELETFGSLVDAFSGALEKIPTVEEEEAGVTGEGNETGRLATSKTEPKPKLVENPGLVRFFKVLSGCLSKSEEGKSVSPDTATP